MTTPTLNERDNNIHRLAEQHSEAIVAHVTHVNGYGFNDAQFDVVRDVLAAALRRELYSLDGGWMAEQQAGQR